MVTVMSPRRRVWLLLQQGASKARSMIKRRQFIAGLGGAMVFLSHATRAQEEVPRVVFSPTLGVSQHFRVSYRLRETLTSPTSAIQDRFIINYRLTVTPVAREKDGFRLRLLVSEVERPGSSQDGMNMVVAATLMLDGLPFEMLVDVRGFLQEVDAKQVAWHLARALEAMNFARLILVSPSKQALRQSHGTAFRSM
jgi:hypothetical protein